MINLTALGIAAGVIFIYMNLIFFLAALLRKNDIVDVAWGLGFVTISLTMLILYPGYDQRRLLVSLLIAIWGLRLAGYIFLRNRGKQEDFRYAAWRKQWGKHWLIRSYLQVFILQGFFMLTIAYPVILYLQPGSSQPGILDFLGLIIWLIGFYFEAVGDAQMMRFKADPANKGRIMDQGLWCYTRHPNYFGETAMWWGIFFITLAQPHGWIGVVSPVVISFLLLRVSGVPMLEKKYAENPAYREYIRRTSSFFPLPPRK